MAAVRGETACRSHEVIVSERLKIERLLRKNALRQAETAKPEFTSNSFVMSILHLTYLE